jgi:HlyD family secretion protein
MTYIQQHKRIILAALLICLAGLILYFWLRPTPTEAWEIAEQEYIPSLLLSGEVIAEGSTQISSPLSGKVLACPVAKGEQVIQGQLLIQLDNSQALIDRDRAANAVQTAAAQLEKARTVTFEEASAKKVQAELALEKATRHYENTKVLADNGAASQWDLEQAERDLRLNQELARSAETALQSLSPGGSGIAVLQAELDRCQLDLHEKEMILSEYKITAPADGKLLNLYVQPGELLTANNPAALLAAGSELRVQVKPDQRYASLTALGNKAQVWITSDAAVKWDAQVVYTEPLANAEQGSFTAELTFFENPPLYPGQLVSVQLFSPTQNAIILPEKYLTTQEGQNGVWKASEGKARFIPVQMGLRADDGVVITSGLQTGDLVLAPEGLQENQRIKPRQGKV